VSPGRMKVLRNFERKWKSGSTLGGVNSQAETKVCQGSVASDVSFSGIQQFKFLSFYVRKKKSKKMLHRVTLEVTTTSRHE